MWANKCKQKIPEVTRVLELRSPEGLQTGRQLLLVITAASLFIGLI